MKKLKLLLSGFLLTILPYCNSQSPFENWSTLNIKGEINPKWTLAVEGEQRYNHPNNYIRYFHT